MTKRISISTWIFSGLISWVHHNRYSVHPLSSTSIGKMIVWSGIFLSSVLNTIMGFCKIDSDLWTISLFYDQRIAFWMLSMIGLVIFDKTWDWLRKSLFNDQTTKKLSLKISELVQDKLKIFVQGENSPFYLSADKNLDLFDDWLYVNRLVQSSQLDIKESLETI